MSSQTALATTRTRPPARRSASTLANASILPPTTSTGTSRSARKIGKKAGSGTDGSGSSVGVDIAQDLLQLGNAGATIRAGAQHRADLGDARGRSGGDGVAQATDPHPQPPADHPIPTPPSSAPPTPP